jgi:hypothetical protein
VIWSSLDAVDVKKFRELLDFFAAEAVYDT